MRMAGACNGARTHAPNENVRLDEYIHGIRYMACAFD
jgi:acetylornithine deacetylase/succinyl-diaminopimelate desuccinylase-like protein